MPANEEAVAKSKQETDSFLARYRLPDQANLADQEARAGQPMWSPELVKRITKLNPNLIVIAPTPYGPKGIAFHWGRDGKYIVGWETGFVPEFSFVVPDERNLPAKFVRGWREVLHKLIVAKAITLRQALEVFGEAHNITSDVRWKMNIREYR